MTRLAAVDCGTNSVRLLVSDVAGGAKHDVHREMRIVRLGEGVDATGELSQPALARTADALAGFATTCDRLGADRVRMVATSATRDARNAGEFAGLVRQVLGVDPVVATGAEEAALSFAGATRELDPADGPFLVVDIGGGSTEVVLGGVAVRAARSVDVGCVRLTERRLLGDPPGAAEVAAARADVDEALELVAAAVPVHEARTVVGLAGSVTTVAALALGLKAYDPTRLHLARVTAPQVREATARLLAATREQRAAMPFMHPGRVDVIGAGALVLLAVVERFGVAELVVSESDILDGIVWAMSEGSGP